MSARPSCQTYGNVMDASADPYVECVQCNVRFVGGDHERRTRRWIRHAEESGCRSATARREAVGSAP